MLITLFVLYYYVVPVSDHIFIKVTIGLPVDKHFDSLPITIFWFEVVLDQSPLNFILYIVFSLLFGAVASLSIYNWSNRSCSIRGSAGSGGFGSVLALFTSQCSACVSLASLFLPTAAVGLFTTFNTVLNFISIGLMLLAIRMMGGFERNR